MKNLFKNTIVNRVHLIGNTKGYIRYSPVITSRVTCKIYLSGYVMNKDIKNISSEL